MIASPKEKKKRQTLSNGKSNGIKVNQRSKMSISLIKNKVEQVTKLILKNVKVFIKNKLFPMWI